MDNPPPDAGKDLPLFSRTEVEHGGTITAPSGELAPRCGIPPLFAQVVGLSFRQRITRLYELAPMGGRTKVYMVGGRPDGIITAEHMSAHVNTMHAFCLKFSDVCRSDNDADVQLFPGRESLNNSSPPEATYTTKRNQLVSVGMSLNVGDQTTNEQSVVRFEGMEVRKDA
jgi:hypothetical protein